MIEYTKLKNSKNISVKVHGIKTGTIKRASGGYQYFPLKSTKGGEIFNTLPEVKQSLEIDID